MYILDVFFPLLWQKTQNTPKSQKWPVSEKTMVLPQTGFKHKILSPFWVVALQFFQKGIGVGVRVLRAGCDEELENGSPGGSEEHHGPIAMWACLSVHHHSVQLVP